MRTVWLMGGDRPGSGFELLANAFEAAGGVKVERVGADQAVGWLQQVREAELASPLPNLLVVEAELAWRDEAMLLSTVGEFEPWASLPLVVVARADDDERCARTYALGAAGWVVLPEAPERAEWAAEAFATYWSRTTLLPTISPRVGQPSRSWTH